MQVILMERVAKLGLMGDVVDVKPGFARNYLLPQGKALTASISNIESFKAQKAQLEAAKLQQDAALKRAEISSDEDIAALRANVTMATRKR